MRAHRVVIVGLVIASLCAAVVGGQMEWMHHREVGESWIRALALVGGVLVGLSWAAVGAILAWLRPRNTLGWMILGVGTLTQFSMTEESLAQAGAFGPLDPHSLYLGRPTEPVLSLVVGFSIYCLLGLLPAFYPTGRLRSKRWLVPSLVVVVGAFFMQWQWWCGVTDCSVWPMGADSLIGRWIPGAVFAAGLVGVWALSVVRMLSSAFPERLQLIWLFGAVVVTLAAQFLGDSTGALLVQSVSLYALPVAIVVGIVRYRLLGLEIVLRGALVYGVLTGVLVAVQAGLGAVAGIRFADAALPAVLAAAVVAVGLNPVRTRLQRAVDRFVHGRRSEPIHAVSDLGSLVASVGEDVLLGEMLSGVRDAVRSRWVCLRAIDGGIVAMVGDDPAVDHGPTSSNAAVAPAFTSELTVSGIRVGVLEVAARGPGERYSAQDELLLTTMSTQVAVVVRAIQLTAELARERDAVLGATLRERQRLRRDLHDGLGPSLTGVRLGVEAISDALRSGEHQLAEEITDVLRREMMGTVTEMRRILTDLRPLVLSEEGLVPALQHRIASVASPIRVEIQAEGLPWLSQEVEEAAYLVAAEALNNVVKHSGASLATVNIDTLGSRLILRVTDDGDGFPPGAGPGIGLDSMRERAEALDGQMEVASTSAGTTVTLAVPIAGRAP